MSLFGLQSPGSLILRRASSSRAIVSPKSSNKGFLVEIFNLLERFFPEAGRDFPEIHDVEAIERREVVQLLADGDDGRGRDLPGTFDADIDIRTPGIRALNPRAEKKHPVRAKIQMGREDGPSLFRCLTSVQCSQNLAKPCLVPGGWGRLVRNHRGIIQYDLAKVRLSSDMRTERG